MTASASNFILVDKIKALFPDDYMIELYILDERGLPFELFSGLTAALTPYFMQQVLFVFLGFMLILN